MNAPSMLLAALSATALKMALRNAMHPESNATVNGRVRIAGHENNRHGNPCIIEMMPQLIPTRRSD
jgi:hypothetical protein